jgi:shikimate kinase
MGSGKSTVGRKLAQQLGWHFEDIDEAIIRDTGMSIAEIFEDSGESCFRLVEGKKTEEILSQNEVVIATGGGWGAVPGRFDKIPDGTITIWLAVSPEEAIRRVRNSENRPLLSCSNPLEKARDLLRERSNSYSQAEHKVDTDGLSVEDVSVRILEIIEANNPRNGM